MPEPSGAPARQAPGAGFDRLLLALICGQVGMHAAMAGLRMAAPLQLLREGHAAWAVGVVLALFALAPVLLALPAGRLADRLGYHRPVALAVCLTLVGLLSAIASTFVTGAPHLLLLALGAMATGAGTNTGMLTIQRTAGLAARDGTERMRIFSWLGIAPSFSNVLGPVLVGFVIDALGFRAAYASLLLLPVLTIASLRVVPRLPPPVSLQAPAPRLGTWALIREPAMARLLLVNWLLSMCWDVHLFAVPILGHDRGFSAATIGLVLGAFTASVTAVRVLIPWMAHRLSEVRVLQVAMVGTGLVFAAYPFAPNPWVMGACAVLLGITLGSVQPMVMSMLHHITPHERHGEALAVRSMTLNMSSTVMPLLFGLSGTLLGAALLFWLVGAAVAGGASLAKRITPDRP